MGCKCKRLGIYGEKKKISRRRKTSPKLRESCDMTKTPGIISTSAKPGVLVSVIPDGLGHVNTYTVGKVSTDCQYKKFSSTDDGFFCTVGT